MADLYLSMPALPLPCCRRLAAHIVLESRTKIATRLLHDWDPHTQSAPHSLCMPAFARTEPQTPSVVAAGGKGRLAALLDDGQGARPNLRQGMHSPALSLSHAFA